MMVHNFGGVVYTFLLTINSLVMCNPHMIVVRLPFPGQKLQMQGSSFALSVHLMVAVPLLGASVLFLGQWYHRQWSMIHLRTGPRVSCPPPCCNRTAVPLHSPEVLHRIGPWLPSGYNPVHSV